MANLDFCDKHNMVAFLKKPEGSEGFHQIVDFLNSTHIKYALTKNLTIYVSLIHQFWQTASASTSENREMDITATIDGRVKTVTEASIKRHLKLEDSNGISTLPNTEIFEQLALMRQETKVPQLSSPPHTNVADEAASTGVDVRHRGATTTVNSLDAGQGINKIPSMPYDLPLPRGHTLESDEGRMQQNKLMDLVTKLSDRCEALETDLRQTKKVYGDAFTRLVKKVKKLEKTVKTSQARRRSRVVISDDEEELEDPSKQGRREAHTQQDQPKDHLRVLSAAKVLADVARKRREVVNVQSYTRRRRAVSTDSGEISIVEESVSTAEQIQISRDEEVALKLQEEFDAVERQRIARVHKEASSFNIEEWEDIQATIKADEELSEGDKTDPELTIGSSKRVAEVKLDHEGSKKQNTNEASGSVQEQPKEERELTQEDLQQTMIVVPVEEVYVEALHVKYPIIDMEERKVIRREGGERIEVEKRKELWGIMRSRVNIMDWYPEHDNGIYDIVDRVMRLVVVVQACKPRKDRVIKKGHHSTSSSTSYHHGLFSHQFDDDEEIQDEATSRTSSPSPTTYLNSLVLIRPHVFKNPTSPKQNTDTLFNRQTLLLNRQQQMHEEQRGAFKTFGKALKGVFARRKK
ncbi:hypothetical protein Tco_0110005 [Tanacetum coccineum]